MCPSFMATGEELHSTRGRAHMLWELMQGEVLPNQWKNEQVKESLDLCLACKACKSECPVSVDMATYKAEFLSHHYEGKSPPLSHYAFGRIDVFARLAGFAPNLVNLINNAPGISSLIKSALHIHPQRTFPPFAKPFTREPLAAKLRDQTFLLSEFLVKYAPDYQPPPLTKKLVVHGHCHHRATMSMKDEMKLLRATGAEVELLDSGCCGMAGPFGFEKDKYELSQKLGERVLLPAIRNNTNAIIVSDGFSCCEQITQNTNARPMHLAEVLAGSDR